MRITVPLDRPIRVGVLGVWRGGTFAEAASESVGMQLVAVCDKWEARLNEVGQKHGVATYTDFDRFLEHDMDAVVLANYFHQHAPFAIRALRAGKHVMSETAACTTMAEGVALCRAVEETGLTYMFGENYPFTVFNQEMQRLYRAGEIGRVVYAEGEYNHPMSPAEISGLSPGFDHWRNWLPSTYYCTHAMAPLMTITGTMPVTVNGLSIAAPELNADTAHVADAGSVILCRMDNGAVFRLFGLFVPGHSCWYRLHGTRGAMEMTRGPGYFGPGQVRVWHEEWNREVGQPLERTYAPEWPNHADEAQAAGHGGGDFWTNLRFAEAIRTGEPPFLDVYRGVAMSCVGILGWRSAQADGAPQAVPDFRVEASRAAFENDHWSPWPDGTGDGTAPPSILGRHEPNPAGAAAARRIWTATGYQGPDA
jgi:predicted dehydrogenase